MGQDISIVFVPQETTATQLIEAATQAFAAAPPKNLVILVSRDGPACVRAVVPSFTAVSVWADVEDGLSKFAAQLSQRVGPVAVITLADHSCIGGWWIFEHGQARDHDFCAGDGYTACGIEGLGQLLGVELQPSAEVRLWFVERFLRDLSGHCVFGSAPNLHPGKPVSSGQIRAILESDLPGAAIECMMLLG